MTCVRLSQGFETCFKIFQLFSSQYAAKLWGWFTRSNSCRMDDVSKLHATVVVEAVIDDFASLWFCAGPWRFTRLFGKPCRNWGNVGKIIWKRRLGAKRRQRLFVWMVEVGVQTIRCQERVSAMHTKTRKFTNFVGWSSPSVWWLWQQSRWFVDRRLADSIATRASYCEGRKKALLARNELWGQIQ